MSETVEKARQRVWQIVHAIPVGQVATYGQVARLAGMPQQSRLVGKVLSGLPEGSKIPWHRVVNSQGKITNPNDEQQVERLAEEGVTPINGRIRLSLYQWQTS